MNTIIETILEEKYPEYKQLPIVEDLDADNPREDFWDNLSEKEVYDINKEYLEKIANPEYDYLMCWEPGRLNDDEKITDFSSLYEFDYDWWEYQKKARYDSLEEYKEWMEKGSEHWTPERVATIINELNAEYENGYSIYCTGDWIRLIEDGIFRYAQIISAKWFIYYRLESLISDLQDKYLPYSLNEDDMDFTQLLNETDPTKKYKANGRELELESLQEKIRDYERKQLETIIDNEMKKYNFSGKVFREDKGYDAGKDFDPFTSYIFWDEQSLKNINPKSFVKDIKANLENIDKLESIIKDLGNIVEDDFMSFYNANRARYLSKQ